MDDSYNKEDQLVCSLYDAAVNPTLWPDTIARIANLCDTRHVFLTATDLHNPHNNFLHLHGISAPLERDFRKLDQLSLENEHLSDNWYGRIDLGAPSNSDDFFGGPEGFRQAGGRYVELLNKHDIRRQLTVVLEKSEFQQTRLILASNHPFPDQAQPVLRRLSPHLQRALRMQRQLNAGKHENDRLYGMLDAMSDGVILLNAAGKVRYINPRAFQILRQHDGLMIAHDALAAPRAERHQQLQLLLRDATGANRGAGKTAGTLTLDNSSGRTKLVLTARPLKMLSQFRELAKDAIAAVVFLRNPDRSYHICERLLHDNFGLSPREADICQRFINTPVLDDLSEQTGLAMHSLRSVLKSIYEKTGQHSQAELMRLLIGLRNDYEYMI